MGSLFSRTVKTIGNFKTTKTTNKRTGKTSTSTKRVKPSGGPMRVTKKGKK